MGALKIRMFDGDRIDTVWKPNGPNVLVRHLAQRNHQEASVASRKTSEAKKRVTLQSLGPIKNEVEGTLWSPNSGEASCAFEQHVGVRCKSENSRTKEDGASRKFGTCEPKKMVTL